MSIAERYEIRVRKVEEDGELFWRATVREFPDIAEYATSAHDAIDLVADAIDTLHDEATRLGKKLPAPIADEDAEYSGRVTFRMPPYLHREVANRAEADGMSLNQYILSTLLVSLADRVERAGAHWRVMTATPSLAVSATAGSGGPYQIGGTFFSDPIDPDPASASFTWAVNTMNLIAINEGDVIGELPEIVREQRKSPSSRLRVS